MPYKRSENVVARAARRKARLGMILVGLGMVAACLVIRHFWGADPANADPAAQASGRTRAAHPAASTRQPATTGGPSGLQVVATVNGREITRELLGRECLRHYGKEVLESLVNKLLIAQECKRRNIALTAAEVDAEIQRMAQRFSLSKDQWLKMLKTERGINPTQYANDIIWPTLALRRLAGERLKVTQEEMVEVYEIKYGPKVRVRLISCRDLQKAKRLHAAAVAKPDDFGNLAKNESEDSSASFKGLVQPICKHGSYKEIEQAAFNMKDGEISDVIQASGQYVILKREGLLPAAKHVDFQQAAPQLEELVRDRKLRAVAHEIFRELQDRSVVKNVFNDPAASREMPGVAAVINGRKITVGQLAQECIQRHGQEVLEGTINRKLIEMACEKQKIEVTGAEIDQEIVRAASVSVKPRADGSPDVAAWLKLVTERQGVSVDVYRRDSVWPSVALKKLVGDKLWATNEDLQEDLRKGYEANYGPRVRCLAIVMDNPRRAQKVWEMARKRLDENAQKNIPENTRRELNAEHYGDLAAQYSIEPGSSALRGEVPPIKKHGGQPLLEEAAFSLKPGELSGLIQVSEQYIILFCLGYTKPTEVSFDQVRSEIYEHIREKKQRIAMAKYFQHLQDTATIDNYLAGTTHRPTRPAGPRPAARIPTLRQVPSKR